MSRLAALIVLVAGCTGASAPATEAADAPLVTFPGFSLAISKGRVTKTATSYASGRIAFEDVDSDGSSISIRWAPGSVDAGDLPAAIETDRAVGVSSSPMFTPGSNGSAIPTIVTPLANHRIERSSVLTCGTRRVYVEMTGRDVAARHAALVHSFACHADPAREPAPGAIRLALDLPHWFTQSDGRLAGQLNLTDGEAINVILHEVPLGARFEPREELTWVRDAVLDDPIGERHPYAGTDRGNQIRGFLIEKNCATYDVRINAYALVASAARLEALVAPLTAARCLDHDEPPPSWPDAPTR